MNFVDKQTCIVCREQIHPHEGQHYHGVFLCYRDKEFLIRQHISRLIEELQTHDVHPNDPMPGTATSHEPKNHTETHTRCEK